VTYVNKIWKGSLIFLSCLLFSGPWLVYGQKYNVLNFSTADGLPSQIINDVYQDRDGYLWFATQDGVSIFNGNEFTEFAPIKELRNIDAVSIAQDQDGRIYIGTNTSGIFIYDYNKVVQLNEKNGLPSNVVRKLYLDKDQTIWALTSSGVCKIKDGKTLPFFDPEGLMKKGVLSMTETKNRDLWFGTQGNGLIRYAKGKFEYFRSGDGILDDYIFSLSSRGDSVLIGTTSQGVVIAYKGSFDQIDVPEISQAWISAFPEVNNYIEIVSSSGLVRYFNDGRYEWLSEQNGLCSNDLYNGFYDRERNLWLTSGNGVSCLRKEEIVTLDKETGLSDSKITCLTRLANKTIASGTYGSGIDILNTSGQVIKRILPKELVGVKITVITEFLKENELWVGTDLASHGIIVLDNKTFQVKKKIKTINGVFIQTVTRIEKDRKNRLWIGTFNAGMFVISGKDTIQFNDEHEVPSNEVYTFIVDREGNPWVSFYQKGLFTLKNGKFVRIKTNDRFILSVLQDNSGKIIAGSKSSGIYVIDANKISNFTKEHGLLSNTVSSLAGDQDLLWIGTNKGLNLIRISGNKIIQNVRYDKKNGFVIPDLQQNALVSGNGVLWCGSSAGISIIHSHKESQSKLKPVVAINNVRLFFEATDWRKKNKSVKVNKYGVPISMTLEYKENHLTFEFCAFSTGASSYTYILEGQDDKWTPLSEKRDVTYSNLAPGEYVFKVCSVDNYGVKSDPAVVRIIIKSPFWQTWWFRILALLTISGGIYAFIRYRERSYKERQQILEKTVAERTSEVRNAYETVEEQRRIVEDKNKEILDSITYAKRIQSAMLPSIDLLQEQFEDIFVFYRPKDIVAGDFYWFEQIEHKKLIAVADCTGHGVPGAMISVVCNNALNRSIREYGVNNPAEILDKTRELILEEFSKYKEEVNDGMDISLLLFDPEKKIIQWTGANLSLLIMKTGESTLQELKGDKMPVGQHLREGRYTLQEFKVAPGDQVYMTSDGYADQFGGEKGKKLKSAELKRIIEKNASLSMNVQCLELEKTFDAWRGNYDQVDDVCVIGIRF
jgi:ligand-binding sensor domain-containing protein/serine phosphatase RsbU (regulator of sigma subunit)